MEKKLAEALAGAALKAVDAVLLKAAEPLLKLPDDALDRLIELMKDAERPESKARFEATIGKPYSETHATASRVYIDVLLTARSFRSAANAYVLWMAESMIASMKAKEESKP
jgi:hypothetical protein